jgi:hypothetical protein
LILITALATLVILFYQKIANNFLKLVISYCLLFLSCLLILSFSLTDLILDFINGQELSVMKAISNVASWNYNPLNFLPYLFTASITVQELYYGNPPKKSPQLRKKLWCLFCLFLIFTLLEWFVLKNLVHYSRLSLVFGSICLAILVIMSPSVES